MPVKTVALDPEAYGLLRGRKRPEETFSDVVKRLARPRRPLTDFIGAWSEDTNAEMASFDKLRRRLREERVPAGGN